MNMIRVSKKKNEFLNIQCFQYEYDPCIKEKNDYVFFKVTG